jgi:putative DNA primase/helicase
MEPQRTLKPLPPLVIKGKPTAPQDSIHIVAQKFGSFILKPSGVFHITKRNNDEQKEEFVCSRLEVIARSRDEGGLDWGYVLCWRDPDGGVHTWSAPADLTVTNDTQLGQALVAGGLTMAPGMGTQLRKYIVAVNPAKRILNVSRPGWHKIKEGGQSKPVFALPDQVIGTGSDLEVILQEATYNPSARVTTGTLEEWKQNVAASCVGNDHLLFAVSIPFAAPTLELLGKPSGGFHLHGLSSSGKSTALKVAASVWGYPVLTWRTTDNALEDTAERHNDVLLPLDELSQVDAKKAGETAYMLGNGEGKQRLTPSTTPQKKKHWRLLFLSTGELTLAAHAETAGVKTKAGTGVRMVDIDADAGTGMGIFNNIHESPNPAAFADSIKTNATQYQGTAGPQFIEYLIKNEAQALEKLKTLIDEFTGKNVQKDSSGEIHRVAERFALVGAAGELATEAGITGWAPGEAMQAAKSCFDSWLSKRSLKSIDMDKAISQVRGFLLANPARFETISDHEISGFPTATQNRPVINRAGFIQKVDGAVEYLIPGESFNVICKGYDPTRVAKELEQRGLLRRGKDRLKVQQRIEGNVTMRVYAIQGSILSDGDDESLEEGKAE